MKFLDSKVHGYIDYASAVLFLIMPSIFKMQAETVQSMVFYIFAVFTLFLALQTDYELGLYKIFPFATHLVVDFLSGLFLLVSPWIFNFSGVVFLPHLMAGILVMTTSLITVSEPQTI
jgi:hypothetical protein